MPRILIIEDEDDILEALVTIFEMEGCEVTGKTTGSEGLNEARCKPPDLLISDIMLPDISGIEITRQLRTTPQTACIPIILMTANNEPELHQRSIEAGAIMLLRKPFQIDELLTAAQQFLEAQEHE